MKRTRSGIFSAFAVPLLITASAFGQKHTDIDNIGKRDINQGESRPMTMNLEKEVALGRLLSRELEQSIKLLDAPAIAEYINRIGQKIASNSDLKIPVSFKVVDSDEINASALPGGFIYVNTGLITASGNEAELAAMIATAIASVAARHAVERQGAMNFFSVLQSPQSSTFPVMLSIAPPSVSALFFTFTRKAAEEADFLGLQYAYKAGYDPNAIVSFFQKMTAMSPANKVSPLFATHPPTEDRARKATDNITKLLPPRPQYIVTTSEFDQVKAQLFARNRK